MRVFGPAQAISRLAPAAVAAGRNFARRLRTGARVRAAGIMLESKIGTWGRGGSESYASGFGPDKSPAVLRGAPALDTAAGGQSEISLPILADQLIDDGTTLGEMLARVNSVETAEEVRPSINALVKEYRALFATVESMESPNVSDMAAMASRARPLAETQRRVATEIERIYRDHPYAADILREALNDLAPE